MKVCDPSRTTLLIVGEILDQRNAAEADAAYWQERAEDAEARLAAVEDALDR